MKKENQLNSQKNSANEIIKSIYESRNHSWYVESYERNKNNLDDIAIIYRGNKITYGKYGRMSNNNDCFLFHFTRGRNW